MITVYFSKEIGKIEKETNAVGEKSGKDITTLLVT
jgi:hypothetical protein